MTAPSAQALIIRDTEGEFYVIPLGVIEQGRVPEQHKAELETALADETAGYWLPRPATAGNLNGGICFGMTDVRVLDLFTVMAEPATGKRTVLAK